MARGAWTRVGPAPPRRLHLQTAAALGKRRWHAVVPGGQRFGGHHVNGAVGTELQREGLMLSLEPQAIKQQEGRCPGEGQGDVQVGAARRGCRQRWGARPRQGLGGSSPITGSHQAESAAYTGPSQKEHRRPLFS